VATWKSVRAAEHQRILWRRLHLSRHRVDVSQACWIAKGLYIKSNVLHDRLVFERKSWGWRHMVFGISIIHLVYLIHLHDRRIFLFRFYNICITVSNLFYRINKYDTFDYWIDWLQLNTNFVSYKRYFSRWLIASIDGRFTAADMIFSKINEYLLVFDTTRIRNY